MRGVFWHLHTLTHTEGGLRHSSLLSLSGLFEHPLLLKGISYPPRTFLGWPSPTLLSVLKSGSYRHLQAPTETSAVTPGTEFNLVCLLGWTGTTPENNCVLSLPISLALSTEFIRKRWDWNKIKWHFLMKEWMNGQIGDPASRTPQKRIMFPSRHCRWGRGKGKNPQKWDTRGPQPVKWFTLKSLLWPHQWEKEANPQSLWSLCQYLLFCKQFSLATCSSQTINQNPISWLPGGSLVFTALKKDDLFSLPLSGLLI